MTSAASADEIHRNTLGGKLDVSFPSQMEDVSVSDHQTFLTRFAMSVDGETSFAASFAETYSTAPRDVSAALADQVRSMGLKISKEGLTKTLGSGIETYCATPERNDSATVEVCLIVPKDDTVKVVSFDAPNDLGWRRSARAIVESIKPGRRVQWGGTAKLGVNMLKLQLDNAWSLELKESSTFTYRLLRRAEFGQVGPSCDLSLNFGRCKDDSALAELHGKLAARMTCDGSHCDAQIDKISDYCVVASCDAVATQSEQLELQTMLKSVDRSPEPRGR